MQTATKPPSNVAVGRRKERKGLTQSAKNDRRTTPFFMVRLPDVFEIQLELLAKRNVTTITEEVRKAVREYLERNKLWPPEPD